MTDLALGRVWSLGVLVRFRLSLVLLLATLAYGTVGYQLVEGWNPLDSFYMTVITLSTVGFREVNPLTAGGADLHYLSHLPRPRHRLFGSRGSN